jgi:hypothetical protein
MSRAIDVTPTLTGEDARHVRASLSRLAPQTELDRRREAARRFSEIVSPSAERLETERRR